eukprot:scaffold70712_cov31-Tisochrysis_lutea.AAC.3
MVPSRGEKSAVYSASTGRGASACSSCSGSILVLLLGVSRSGRRESGQPPPRGAARMCPLADQSMTATEAAIRVRVRPAFSAASDFRSTSSGQVIPPPPRRRPRHDRYAGEPKWRRKESTRIIRGWGGGRMSRSSRDLSPSLLVRLC